MKILVTAGSQHDATRGIAQAIASELERHGLDVTILAPEDVASVDDYDAVVLGSAVYTGHWLPAVTSLVARFEQELGARRVWLFSSGPVGDPSRKLVQKMNADPVDLPAIRAATGALEHRMFAGKLDRETLTRPQRAALAIFRNLEGDFRNWDEIRDWASSIADALQEADCGIHADSTVMPGGPAAPPPR